MSSSAEPRTHEIDEYTQVQIEAGCVRDPEGNPFRRRLDATAAIKELDLNNDEWEIEKSGTGWEINRILSDDDEDFEEGPSRGDARDDDPAEEWIEDYKRVRFHAKGQPNDPELVVLSVNGECLQIQREQEVVLPRRFMEAADHATYKHFSHQPGQDRKVDYSVAKYPYTILGEATQADFTRMRRSGTLANRRNMQLQENEA
jgi:hypothetical protein